MPKRIVSGPSTPPFRNEEVKKHKALPRPLSRLSPSTVRPIRKATKQEVTSSSGTVRKLALLGTLTLLIARGENLVTAPSLVQLTPCALTPFPIGCAFGMTLLNQMVSADEIISTPPFSFSSNPSQIKSCNQAQIAGDEIVTVCEEGPSPHSKITHLRWNGTDFSLKGSPVLFLGQDHPQVLKFQNNTYGVVTRNSNNLTFTELDQNDQVLGKAIWPWSNTTNNYPYNAMIAPDSYPCVTKLNETTVLSVHTVVDSTGTQFDVVGLIYEKGTPFGSFKSWAYISDTSVGNSTGASIIPFQDGSFVVPWINGAPGSIVAKHYDRAQNAINYFTVALRGSCQRGCALPDGSYVIAWLDVDIYLQRLAANDTLIGSPIKVNTSPINALCTNYKQFLDLGVVGEELTVLWLNSPNQTALPQTVTMQRLNFTGTFIGTEEVVATNSNSTSWPTFTGFQSSLLGWLTSWIESGSTAFTRLYQLIPVTPTTLVPTSTPTVGPTTVTPIPTLPTTSLPPLPTTNTPSQTSAIPTTSGPGPTTTPPPTPTPSLTAPLESVDTSSVMNYIYGVVISLACLCLLVTTGILVRLKLRSRKKADPERASISSHSSDTPNYQSTRSMTRRSVNNNEMNTVVDSSTTSSKDRRSSQQINESPKNATQYETFPEQIDSVRQLPSASSPAFSQGKSEIAVKSQSESAKNVLLSKNNPIPPKQDNNPPIAANKSSPKSSPTSTLRKGEQGSHQYANVSKVAGNQSFGLTHTTTTSPKEKEKSQSHQYENVSSVAQNQPAAMTSGPAQTTTLRKEKGLPHQYDNVSSVAGNQPASMTSRPAQTTTLRKEKEKGHQYENVSSVAQNQPAAMTSGPAQTTTLRKEKEKGLPHQYDNVSSVSNPSPLMQTSVSSGSEYQSARNVFQDSDKTILPHHYDNVPSGQEQPRQVSGSFQKIPSQYANVSVQGHAPHQTHGGDVTNVKVQNVLKTGTEYQSPSVLFEASSDKEKNIEKNKSQNLSDSDKKKTSSKEEA